MGKGGQPDLARAFLLVRICQVLLGIFADLGTGQNLRLYIGYLLVGTHWSLETGAASNHFVQRRPIQP